MSSSQRNNRSTRRDAIGAPGEGARACCAAPVNRPERWSSGWGGAPRQALLPPRILNKGGVEFVPSWKHSEGPDDFRSTAFVLE